MLPEFNKISERFFYLVILENISGDKESWFEIESRELYQINLFWYIEHKELITYYIFFFAWPLSWSE